MKAVLPRFPRACVLAIAVGIALHLVLTSPLVGPDRVPSIWPQRLMMGLCVLAAILAGARWLTDRRPLWLWIATGVATWAVGDVYYTLVVASSAGAQFPTLADALWLLSYIAFFRAVVLVVGEGIVGRDPGLWLDGVVAGLVTASIGTFVVLPAVDLGSAHGLAVVVTAAYPVLDVLLLGAVAGGWVLTGGNPAGTWRWLGAGLAALAVTDIVFAFRVAAGTYHPGSLTDAGWPLAFLALAWAGWAAADRRPPRILTVSRVPVTPLLCSAAAVVIMVVDEVVVSLPEGGVLMGLAALTLGLVRTALALRANVRLQDTARLAVTDDLTGLGNRRRLQRDLAAVIASGGGATLALFDLDGFKAYNDAYGHPAGDALLTTLGARLRAAVGTHGRAYRLGGDEFCVLADAPGIDHALVLDRSLGALEQEGHGFVVAASYGSVRVPDDAADGVEALQLADTRMYQHKDARRASTRRHTRDLLLQLLHEQQPDLEEHSGDVGELVAAVGRRAGMAGEELEHARHAAELHDVGKVAIPASILDKPGPLDDDEWALMKRHTIIGERILSAVPALVPVGRVVRATHERWDGGGYPDGLRGEEIPLGARVIAVCDTFHAITTDRPYRAGRGAEEALAELRRCAGTQFDPAVVEAFADELASGCDGASERVPGPPTTAPVARQVAPARAVASAAAGELAELAKLRGLLQVGRLAHTGADVTEVLETVARTISTSLGFRVVSINLLRPEWDDVVCTAIEGPQAVREHLLGRVEPLDSWTPFFDERFARGGAYFVPAGAVDFDEDIAWHIPDIAPSDDPGAWDPHDVLFVPLRGRDGELLGMVSVDEPVWGRRPADEELEVLVAVCDHAALAVERATAHERARQARAGARGHLGRVALAGRLAAALSPAEVADAVVAAVDDVYGFGSVGLDHVGSASSGQVLEDLLAAGEDREGTVLLAGDVAERARRWRGVGGATRNGRGPRAWVDHLLAVPARGADGELLAVLWADDPADRLLPLAPTLHALRGIGDQTAVALAWARRAQAGVPARAA